MTIGALIFITVVAIGIWLADKPIKLRNRQVHDTETKGRTE